VRSGEDVPVGGSGYQRSLRSGAARWARKIQPSRQRRGSFQTTERAVGISCRATDGAYVAVGPLLAVISGRCGLLRLAGDA